MTLSTFSARQVALLDTLARYRFLTIPLAVRLGIGNRKQVGDELRGLETARLVKVEKQSKKYEKPYVFYLSGSGINTVNKFYVEDSSNRKILTRTTAIRLGAHLDQKLCTVSVLMALDTWAARAGAKVEWMLAEYDPHPDGKFEHATTLTSGGVTYKSDALAEVVTPDGTSWVLAVEMETGGTEGRIDNFRTHLPARAEVFEFDIVDYALRRPMNAKAARCLYVFDTPQLLKAAKEMVAGRKGNAWSKTLFNSLADVERDFAAGWWKADGTTGSLFR